MKLFNESSSDLFFNLAFLNSKVSEYLVGCLSQTLNFDQGIIAKLPIIKVNQFYNFSSQLIDIAKIDWNNYETSWDFTENPLIRQQYAMPPVLVIPAGMPESSHMDVNLPANTFTQASSDANINLPSLALDSGIPAGMTAFENKAANPAYKLATIYADWQTENRQTIAEMQRLEQENNRLFIDAYGLQDELDADVPLEQITLTVNPKYRYGGNLTDEHLAQRFQADTLAELISYAIGCMMGRYSLDSEGLIYAHEGNVDFDLARYQTFAADDDGIIPLTDQDWFKDDATNRFRDFVRTVWGEDNLQANLSFVAESLCLGSLTAKRGEQSMETIRRYLSNQFYKDHLKTYKKRPIYWLFSSGKQKAFDGLVYLHRYNDSTLPRMRTEYVTPLLGKYDAFADQLKKQLEDATTSEATSLKKELLALEKKQTELRTFDDNLKHYADRRIKLDLDDGVKVNYGKFGDLLAEVKAVTGGKE
jgi:hypothetical protein